MSGVAVMERTGPLCTVQDLGRRLGRRVGISPGGAMDRRALLWANRLLGNDPAAAGLEVSLGGARLRFAASTVVALTGADCAATLSGRAMGNWRSIRVSAGDVLSLDFSATGMRAYLAFPGGLDAPRIFGSASVVLREGLPGPLGRAVRTGDEVRWGGAFEGALGRVPNAYVPPVEDIVELPLLPGYEWDDFSAEDRERLFGTLWTLDPQSDRVASRLSGSTLESGPSVLDSVPLVDGTVQVPGDGRPLVFMRDRPTIGGYPKVGSVDPLSLDRLAQARPGARVRFTRGESDRVLSRMLRRDTFFGITP